MVLSSVGGRAQQLAPFFFGILILRGGHAAFRILALKRIFFPCHAVSELFHELLALGAGDKVGKQQSGVRMGRVSDDGRSTGVCHSHVQGHPVDGRALFFHDNHLVSKNGRRPGDFPGDQQVQKNRDSRA